MFIFIYAAALTYSLYPDWMWMYFVDSSLVNTHYLIMTFLLVYIFPYIVGFLIQRRLYEIQKGFEIIFFVLAIAAQILLFFAVSERYMKVATYAEFRKGLSRPLAETQLVWILSISFVVVMILIVALWIYSRKKAKTS